MGGGLALGGRSSVSLPGVEKGGDGEHHQGTRYARGAKPCFSSKISKFAFKQNFLKCAAASLVTESR